MMKIYSTIAAAALLAGAIVVAPQFGQVSANTRGPASTVTQTTGTKGDRIDIVSRASCRQQDWPYLDRSCVRDPRTEAGVARQVRLVSTDRR